jgi:hypothetical protein
LSTPRDLYLTAEHAHRKPPLMTIDALLYLDAELTVDDLASLARE